MTVRVALPADMADLRAIRRAVFIVEQGVREDEEYDGLDDEALHLVAFFAGRAIGTARILIDGGTGKIGRVAVLAEARGKGFGRALILAALDALRSRGATRAKLGAQTHALGFYESLGFEAFGPEYLDAGIPHRDMVLAL